MSRIAIKSLTSYLSQNVKQIKIKYSNIIKRILISSGFMHVKISKVCAFFLLRDQDCLYLPINCIFCNNMQCSGWLFTKLSFMFY